MGTTIPEYFDQGESIIWVQPDGPNTECKPLFCYDLDTIDEPQGGLSAHLCRKGDGNWETTSQSQGTPGNVTTSVETWYAKTMAWLDKQVERRCPIPLYVHSYFCGRPDIFLNYDRGKLVQNAVIESRSSGSMVKGRADPEEDMEASTRSYDLAAGPPAPEYWKLIWTAHAFAEDEPLKDITFCNPGRCLGPCGTLEDICTDGVTIADAAGGVAAQAWYTVNKGVAWTAASNDPTGATTDKDLASVVCFQVDRDTTRWMVVPNATTATLHIYYTDDGGQTAWTGVQVAALDDWGVHSGALFALDHRHIWLCTDDCDIYFSSDGGLTWSDQGAPAQGASEQLFYIHFIDENVGWCVGGQAATSALLLYTTDGGEHWSEITPTTGPEAKAITAVATLDRYRVWIVNENGKVYYTNDEGDVWTERTMPVTPTKLADVQFIDDFCGWICGYQSYGGHNHPIVFRTFNGGFDWEYYRYEDDYAKSIEDYVLNALWACDYNHAYFACEVLNTPSTSAVLELSSEAPPA